MFLALAALSEGFDYPKLAKRFHKRLGTFASDHARVIDFDIAERAAMLEVQLLPRVICRDRLKCQLRLKNHYI